MSDLVARQRLDTPRTSRRRFSFNVDAEAVGQFSESIARFLGTGRYLAWQTIMVHRNQLRIRPACLNRRWFRCPEVDP